MTPSQANAVTLVAGQTPSSSIGDVHTASPKHLYSIFTSKTPSKTPPPVLKPGDSAVAPAPRDIEDFGKDSGLPPKGNTGVGTALTIKHGGEDKLKMPPKMLPSMLIPLGKIRSAASRHGAGFESNSTSDTGKRAAVVGNTSPTTVAKNTCNASNHAGVGGEGSTLDIGAGPSTEAKPTPQEFGTRPIPSVSLTTSQAIREDIVAADFVPDSAAAVGPQRLFLLILTPSLSPLLAKTLLSLQVLAPILLLPLVPSFELLWPRWNLPLMLELTLLLLVLKLQVGLMELQGCHLVLLLLVLASVLLPVSSGASPKATIDTSKSLAQSLILGIQLIPTETALLSILLVKLMCLVLAMGLMISLL